MNRGEIKRVSPPLTTFTSPSRLPGQSITLLHSAGTVVVSGGALRKAAAGCYYVAGGAGGANGAGDGG